MTIEIHIKAEEGIIITKTINTIIIIGVLPKTTTDSKDPVKEDNKITTNNQFSPNTISQKMFLLRLIKSQLKIPKNKFLSETSKICKKKSIFFPKTQSTKRNTSKKTKKMMKFNNNNYKNKNNKYNLT